MLQAAFEDRKGFLIFTIALVLAAAVFVGAYAGSAVVRDAKTAMVAGLFFLLLVPLVSYLFYRVTIFPYYRRLEDANLELHLKQEELLDTKDDLFIKFLGIYDVNYAANSPRLFSERLTDVADVTARVMEADACLLYLYDPKKDAIVLSATNGIHEDAVGRTTIPLGEGIEGWVGRRLEPVMLKEFHSDPRFKSVPGIALTEYHAVYCLPLYVYSNGALVGVMEVLYNKARAFTDEEINFFTTLSGIISTTIQNEQMQVELRKMNMELEQWVAEKTEEFRASEERYRKLVENTRESILMLAENGDIVFANDEAVHMTGYGKYDLLHKSIFDLLLEPVNSEVVLLKHAEERQWIQHGKVKKSDGTNIPVDMEAVKLVLMGKPFIQILIRDISYQARIEQLLEEKSKELALLKKQ